MATITLEVLVLGDPILRRRSEPIADFTEQALRAEKQDLKEALERFRREHGFGRGIAAPQIGIAKRMIALNTGKGTFVIANPEIVRKSAETFSMWDDCMSFPDLLVRVRRHVSIDVRYMDEDGSQGMDGHRPGGRSCFSTRSITGRHPGDRQGNQSRGHHLQVGVRKAQVLLRRAG